MYSVLNRLHVPDFEFLLAIIRGPVNFTSDKQLRVALDKYARDSTSTDLLNALCGILETEIRYLGSADIAYAIRKVTKQRAGPGVSLQEITSDVYKRLKLQRPRGLLADEELLEVLVQEQTTSRMRKLPIEQQRALLQDVGMSVRDVGKYLKTNTARFAIPALIQVAGVPATQRIVTNVVISTVTEYIGRQAVKSLIGQLAARFPLWAEWLGPVAWGVTGLWTAYDLQGPATRKTVPITLYLGLCMLRDGGLETMDS